MDKAIADLNHKVINAAMSISAMSIGNESIQDMCGQIIESVREYTSEQSFKVKDTKTDAFDKIMKVYYGKDRNVFDRDVNSFADGRDGLVSEILEEFIETNKVCRPCLGR